MANVMLCSKKGKTAAMSATNDTLKDTNVSKGKGKKVSTPPPPLQLFLPSVMITNTRVEKAALAGNPTSNAPTPLAPAVPNFNQEAISILRQMNANQNITNDKVEQLSQRVDELYLFNLQSEEDENLSGNDCEEFPDYQQ